MKQHPHILILGGTAEARKIADQLYQQSKFVVTLSLAGILKGSKPKLPLGINTHIGGFGGCEGLAHWCIRHHVDMIVDMTHPYAEQISRHAAAAAQQVNVPLCSYWRTEWQPEADDIWQYFDSWTEMFSALPAGAHGFLAGGGKVLESLNPPATTRLTARALSLPADLVPSMRYITGLPPKTPDEEIKFFADHGISHILCKNSGGSSSMAKIIAARRLGLPVWMLARPARLPEQKYESLDECLMAVNAWYESLS